MADVFFFIFATQTPLLPPDPEHSARRPSWGHETRPEFVRFGRGGRGGHGGECDHVDTCPRDQQPQGSLSCQGKFIKVTNFVNSKGEEEDKKKNY